jgi:hypothetical protein
MLLQRTVAGGSLAATVFGLETPERLEVRV